MRSRFPFVVAVSLLLVSAVSSGRDPKAGPVTQDLHSPQVRAGEVFRELAKTTYTARRDLPASENIFIEDGRVMEELLAFTMRERPLAVAAGQPARVSRVILMDTAIQVLFQEKCGLVIITPDDQEVRLMSVPQLIDLARRGLNLVFEVYPADQKPKRST